MNLKDWAGSKPHSISFHPRSWGGCFAGVFAGRAGFLRKIRAFLRKQRVFVRKRAGFLRGERAFFAGGAVPLPRSCCRPSGPVTVILARRHPAFLEAERPRPVPPSLRCRAEPRRHTDSGPCAAHRGRRAPRPQKHQQKPRISGLPETAANELEPEHRATTSRDLAPKEHPDPTTHPAGDPDGAAEWSKVATKAGTQTKNAEQLPGGTEHQREEPAVNDLVLAEGRDNVILPGHSQILRDTEECLEDKAPGSMQEDEGNAFHMESMALIDVDGSKPSRENGTHLFSPSLNPTTPNNLVSPSGDTVIRAVKVAVCESQDIGNQGSLVNGESGSRLSAVREGLAQDAKLTIIKKEANFDLRKYDTEKKPAKLFTSDNDRKYQTVIIRETADRKVLENERREIIRNQAVKRSTTIVEKLVSTAALSLGEKPPLGHSAQDQLQVSENANSLSFHGESPTSELEGVNTQQINFVAARQQFLQMEKSGQEDPTSPSPPLRVFGHCSTPSESTLPLPRQDDGVTAASQATLVRAVRSDYHEDQGEEEHRPESPERNNLFTAEKIATLEENEGETLVHENLPICSLTDDLDSGLGEMTNEHGYGYTSDGGASNEMLNLATDSSGASELSEQKSETPIEKEIRLSLEREEVLRKERGIRKSVSSEEMVQIKTKPLLSQLPATAPFLKNKDKNRLAFFVQREIEMDSKREEKLKEEGKVKGWYDKGSAQEVEERKKVFEQQTDVVPVVPQPGWQLRSVSPAEQEPLESPTASEGSSSVQSNSIEGNELGQKSSEWQPYSLRSWKDQTSVRIEREIKEEQRREEELQAQRLRLQAASSLPSAGSVSHSPRVCPERTSGAGASNEDLWVKPVQECRGKKDKSSYAGIEASDDINIEVLQSTRVTCHKSALAHRWEAGIFNNRQDE
ncbi:mitotic interactor and substrate of PLK1-like [Narcine bancroftii]|uniref:mitotic interactor and substrate of PLK1-like n=1 Tax=Narcine bancroftii TaxID=1343680 RepID=UPI003831C3D3